MMTVTRTKLKVINVLNAIKSEIFFVLEDSSLFLTNYDTWTMFFYELMLLLKNTLNEIENLYFKYILNPRLRSLINTMGQTQNLQSYLD